MSTPATEPATPGVSGTAAGTGSLLARRQLGRRLRELREAAGKTLLDVEVSGIGSQSKIYRIESGRTSVRTGDVRDLCVLYAAPEESLDGLLALARASKTGGWQEEYANVLKPDFGLYVDLEAGASTMHTYDAELVHGLLQHPDYAHVTMTRDEPTDEKLLRRLEVWRERRRAVFERPSPLRITQLLGEAALTRVIGSPDTMEAQLAHLRELDRREHIDIRILPWSTGVHPALMGGAFTILGFAAGADPDIVYLESLTTARYLEQESQLREYRRVWTTLTGQSISLREYRQ